MELSTLQPKNVSATASIVCANTNLSRYETGSGFQWRKLDAPESLRSNEGFAAIHNGTMEGYIKIYRPHLIIKFVLLQRFER